MKGETASRAHVPLLVAGVAIHVALLLYFFPKELLASGEPISTFDYALHVYQAQRAKEAFDGWGVLWSYDPLVLAGHPANALEDLSSKSVEIFVIVAMRLGASFGTAFNAYVLLVHLGLLPAAYAAGRSFGFDRMTSSVVLLTWVLLWHFDSFLHWCWFVGMISWGAASYLSVLVVALSYRAFQTARFTPYAGFAIAASVLTLVHPFAVASIALPLGVTYLSAFKKLSLRSHAYLWGGVILAASTPLVWLRPVLLFRHYFGEVDAFLRPPPWYLFFDSLDVLIDVLQTGEPVRTLIRTTALAAAGVMLFRYRKARDGRFAPLATLIVGCLILAYAGGLFWATRQTQPYRHIGPATLGAALSAAPLFRELFSRATFRSFSSEVRVLVALAFVLLLPRLARTVLQFMPTLVAKDSDALAERLAARGETLESPPQVLGHSGPAPAYVEVRDLLRKHHQGRGRVAVVDWPLSEYLAVHGFPVLGGIPQRFVPHADAHPLRHDLSPRDPSDDPVRRYLEQYAVGFVVSTRNFGAFVTRQDLLEPIAAVASHLVYRVVSEPSYFAEGAGRITAQSLNSIKVSGAQGARVVLRFHFLETLACRPDCILSRVEVSGDRAGFIEVRDPPSRFEIVNTYP